MIQEKGRDRALLSIWGITLQQFQGNLKKITTYPGGLVDSSVLQA
jgi:hypothetical protein